MAFLGQLQSKLQEIKTQAMPQVSAVLEQANQRATKARQNLMPVLSKCSQQLDTLGKILQVKAIGRETITPAIHPSFRPMLARSSRPSTLCRPSRLLIRPSRMPLS